MIAIKGRSLVTLDKPFEDSILTPGGLRLFRDTNWSRTEHATIIGTVASVSREIRHFLTVGDRVIFNYLVVCDMDESRPGDVHLNRLELEDGVYWNVEAEHTLGVIRNGEITAAPGYVFMEALPDILLPDMTPGGIWYPEVSRRRKVDDRAIVRHVGEPLEGDLPLLVSPGDTLIYEKKYVERYTIEGRPWLILRHRYALVKQTNGKVQPEMNIH